MRLHRLALAPQRSWTRCQRRRRHPSSNGATLQATIEELRRSLLGNSGLYDYGYAVAILPGACIALAYLSDDAADEHRPPTSVSQML